jgi:hypothetical protein
MPSSGILRRVAHTSYLRGVLRLLVPAKVLSSPSLVTLMMVMIRSSVTSVLTRATRRNMSEDGILRPV